MLQWLVTDLHIHTCLSPCADLVMSPKNIVERARSMKIDVIGISDHNTAENVQATVKAARAYKITVLPGMEVTSSEEVHILALFDVVDSALQLQQTVYEHLPNERNNEQLFGEQIIVNEYDDVKGYNRRLLITATSMNVQKIVDTIHTLGGLALASHIDRETFSIIGQLGFIPPDLMIDGVEISAHTNINTAAQQFPSVQKFPKVTWSDAHFLHDIGKTTTKFLIAEPTIKEIRKALRNDDGRSLHCE